MVKYNKVNRSVLQKNAARSCVYLLVLLYSFGSLRNCFGGSRLVAHIESAPHIELDSVAVILQIAGDCDHISPADILRTVAGQAVAANWLTFAACYVCRVLCVILRRFQSIPVEINNPHQALS